MIIPFAVSCSGKTKETFQSDFQSSTTTAVTAESQDTTTSSTIETTETTINGMAVNPLTGIQDMDPLNVGKRSIAIVVNNHILSIPQRGISKADVIYEYETEGGQTRLLALFADITQVPEIGSLRSARVISTHLAAGTNSIFIHFGYNFRVPDEIEKYEINNIDGNNYCQGSGTSVDGKITLSGNLFFWRDDVWLSTRPKIEHTAVSNGEQLLRAIEYKEYSLDGETPSMFDFVDSASESLISGSECNDLMVYFSSTNDDANFVYDDELQMYAKSQYNGTPQIDETTGAQIYVKNVFVLFANIKSHGDGTIDAFLEDGGSGYYASEGKIIPIIWTKDSPVDPIIIVDSNGDSVKVNSGNSFINIVRDTRMDQTTWS
jgi:hypothetical protein